MRWNIALGTGVCLFAIGGCERQPLPTTAPAASQARSPEVQRAIDSFKAESDAIRALKPGHVFQHPDGLRSIISNDGLYRVAYYCTTSLEEKSEPGIPPVNEPFHVKAMVFSPDVMKDLGELTMHVDAGMPEHGHGMNVEPSVVKSGSRKFMVDNMLFHMSGRWEIYFDITRDGITSRAQDEITLE